MTFREGNESLLDDDNFHEPESDHWWEHETFWFWFFNPERKLGCWSYHYVRPTIGIAGGGVFVFDDTAWFHLETPYYVNYWNTPLPAERDLRDFTFPSGQRIQMLEPPRLASWVTCQKAGVLPPAGSRSTRQMLPPVSAA